MQQAVKKSKNKIKKLLTWYYLCVIMHIMSSGISILFSLFSGKVIVIKNDHGVKTP